jgi:hypothetical protein
MRAGESTILVTLISAERQCYSSTFAEFAWKEKVGVGVKWLLTWRHEDGKKQRESSQYRVQF